MQKKLYFLDEDEKNRILNLHESPTKKQYLVSEQIATTSLAAERPKTSIFGLPDTLQSLTQTGQVEQQKGSITSEEYRTFKNIKPEYNMAKSIGNACKTLKNVLGRSIDGEEQIKQLVSDIYDTWSDSQHTFYLDRSVALSMGEKLKQFKSVPDLCLGIEVSSSVIPKKTTLKQFRRYRVNDNFLKLFWDIQGPGATFGVSVFYEADEALVKRTVYDSLQLIIKKSLEIGSGKPETTDVKVVSKTLVGWDKYPCVINNPNKKEEKRKDGTSQFLIDGFLYWGNGRRMNVSTKEMSNYYCKDNNTIGEGSPQVIDGQANVESGPQVIQGVGKVTSNVRAEILSLLKQVGIEGTDLTQDTINKLYDILSKK